MSGNFPRRTSHLPGRVSLWRPGRLLMVLFFASWALGVGLSNGCTRAQAKAAPEGPPLEVPAPPARVIAPADEPIATAPAEPLEPAPAPSSTSRRPVRRPAVTATEPAQKPDPPPPAEPPLPQSAPAADPVVSAPGPTLRAPGSAEKPIRDLVVRAQQKLSRVDYAKLTEAGKAQYEQSKRFAQQAEQALKDQNFVFAQTLAEKAATLAAELPGG